MYKTKTKSLDQYVQVPNDVRAQKVKNGDGLLYLGNPQLLHQLLTNICPFLHLRPHFHQTRKNDFYQLFYLWSN